MLNFMRNTMVAMKTQYLLEQGAFLFCKKTLQKNSKTKICLKPCGLRYVDDSNILPCPGHITVKMTIPCQMFLTNDSNNNNNNNNNP